MGHRIKVTIGDYVQFSYYKNSNSQLIGYIVSVLQNAIFLDIKGDYIISGKLYMIKT
ncbi:hypothetical protein BACERE00198_05449 [Bacillus cereus]|uniref:DUF2187 domain-containing protein n=1 Tax=Bacillus thuringiensis TaxID=1428 RepID=A0A9X5MYQ0_BACTU|nr:hypothetical protein BTGOE4_60080 [Bacillus thuringiensis]SME73834.1 hypothetical protein BACERE00198_05449 [Bacillus cereus]